jgi:hypothetical protein
LKSIITKKVWSLQQQHHRRLGHKPRWVAQRT